MASRVTLAHLSDVHLPPMPPIAWAELNLKRSLGWLNWWRLRQRQHRMDVLDALVRDVIRQAPDHTAVTGDLVNIGLKQEFEAAERWLATVGPPDSVTIIPGNHDAYCDGALEEMRRHVGAFLGDQAQRGPLQFPFVRRCGPVALIGLKSGVPTPPFNASGRLGAEQLARLDEMLLRLETDGAIRVVLIHHPPLPGQAPARCGLTDADVLQAVLARRGAELVLHGHNHRSMTAWTAGPLRPVPVIGVPSASMADPHGRQSMAAYNLYRLGPTPADPIEVVTRGRDPSQPGDVKELSREFLDQGRLPVA